MLTTECSGLPRPVRERSRSAQVALYGVYEITKFLTAPTPIEAMLSQVLQLLSSFMDMRHGLIAVLKEDGTLDMAADSSGVDASARHYFAQLPEPVIGRIVVTQMPLVIESIHEDPLFESAGPLASKRDPRRASEEWKQSEGEISFIGVPIKDRGSVIGTLTIDRERTPGQNPDFCFDHDVRFLTMVANLLGQTIRLHRVMASDRQRILQDRRRLEQALELRSVEPSEQGFPGIIGDSAALRAVLDKVRLVARNHTTVMLRGESGTGKELFARALHDLSPRKQRAFITLNCAALPESVLESELFGHEKGSFTGASAQRKGRFELADGGTLFLDEIGEISATFQAKLLRVLQLGEFERVGGTTTLKVDVRIVGATNNNLEAAVAAGTFRADLYYRLNVVPILLPPLRERTTDIPLLAREFLRRFNREHDTQLEVSSDALAVVTSCRFPGNVRELENCVRRTATLAASSTIQADDFACAHDECLSSMLWKHPPDGEDAGFIVPLPLGRSPRRPSPQPPGAVVAEDDESWELPALGPEHAGEDDRARLVSVMESVGWVQAKAARVLGLTPRQVGYALRKHEIPIKKF